MKLIFTKLMKIAVNLYILFISFWLIIFAWKCILFKGWNICSSYSLFDYWIIIGLIFSLLIWFLLFYLLYFISIPFIFVLSYLLSKETMKLNSYVIFLYIVWIFLTLFYITIFILQWINFGLYSYLSIFIIWIVLLFILNKYISINKKN